MALEREGGVSISTINIGPLLVGASHDHASAEDRTATASDLLRACETQGLLFVTGHGITPEKRRLAFDNAKRFFSLPEEAKRKIPAKKGGFTRGYIGFGSESGSHRLECKEAFSYGYPWPEDRSPQNSLQGPNIWPDPADLGQDWRTGMIDLFRSMVSVTEAVSRGLSLALGLEGDEDLSKLCQGGDTISLLRVFHYFPYDNGNHKMRVSRAKDITRKVIGEGSDANDGDVGTRPARAGRAGGKPVEGETQLEKIGSSPHTDWGLSTCILQDGAGGLQFLEQTSKRWVDVPCSAEDALVFNCGDYLSLLTKGRLRSPVHQVVTTGKERTSFVFFFYPSFDATLPSAAGNQAGRPDEGEAELTTTARRSGSDVGYNTLLDLKAGEQKVNLLDKNLSFGEYLALKWGDVFRE